MITCKLKGGLCNQLFQIFATIAHSIKCNHSFVFQYSEFIESITPRNAYWDNFLISLRNFTTYNEKLNITNELLHTFNQIHCHQHHFEPIPLIEPNQNGYLEGYFQSYKYFEEYEKNIFSMIHLKPQLDYTKYEYHHILHKDDDSNPYNISMHFRIGDYMHLQQSHNLLPYEYYKNSLENIIDKITSPNIQILYFCEKQDNETVLNIISELSNYFKNKNIENIEFTKVSDEIPDWKQLLLMACCDSNIIANSTFSWWGAYFNRNNDKMVCYPSVWFGPYLDFNYVGDMFPPGWTIINL